jgi:acetyl-CoA acetyltransferase
MLMTKERRPAIRTLRGWAISVLQEAGAIRECDARGWMLDRADPHARERAFEIARQDPPSGASSEGPLAELHDVLDSIGDACPECPPEDLV